MQKIVKTHKSTNNSMSSFGLIEEIMELSHIHLAAVSFHFSLVLFRAKFVSQ
jgi:hypothetical protein